MSLRLRLAIIYGLLLAAALAGFGVAIYLFSASRIYGDVDDNLRVRAQGVVAVLEPQQEPLDQAAIGARTPQLQEEAAAGAIFQIRSPDGRLLYASLEPVSRALPPPGQLGPARESFTTAEVKGQELRLFYKPLTAGGRLLGSVEVAEFLRSANGALDTIRNVLIVGGLLALLITSVSAYAVAGRALGPVRQVSRLARRIERTADFSRRVSEPTAGGEMKELVATFNAMIDRVERTLASQREFLADSSHELRRPLTVLRTNIDLLNYPALPAAEREASLREMSAEAEKMSRLLSDLVLLAREERQAIERAPIDYSSLCSEAVERLRARDDRHELAAEVAAGLCLVGDRERLAQMVSNLLDNAARYTPEGGRIELRLGMVDGIARLEVQDTGIGIPEDELPHVFERFYRGEQARARRIEGTGLGLAIVKYVAEAHGGSVSVSSQPGRGTTFQVDLPVTPKP